MTNRPEWVDRVPAYVLGALDPDEAAAFETVLAGSAELQREVAEYREVCARIAEGESRTPPAQLRQRVMASVGTGRATPEPPFRGAGRRVDRQPLLWLALAASVVLAAVLGRDASTVRRALSVQAAELARAQEARQRSEERLAAMVGPGVEVVVLSATGEQPPAIRVFWNRTASTLVLHASGLPPVPEGHTYQLWVIRDGTPVPSATFTPGEGGQALVEQVAITGAGRVEAYAITQEPAGGSQQPTLPVLFLGRVPAS